jgi:hypothetical protein
MTLNDFALIMMREQDEASDNTELVEVYKTWTEDAIDELLLAHDWRELKRTKTITGTVGDNKYTIDQGVREIIAMRFQDTNEIIDYADAAFLYSIGEDLEKQRKPQFWFWESSVFQSGDTQLKVQFDSKFDSAYIIEFLAVVDPLSLTVANTNIQLQRQMISALKHRVRAFSYEQDDELEKMQIYLGYFNATVEKLKSKDNAKSANVTRLQPRDISNQRDRRLARLDPNHF